MCECECECICTLYNVHAHELKWHNDRKTKIASHYMDMDMEWIWSVGHTNTHKFTCTLYNYRHWKQKQKRKPIQATSANNLFITLLTSNFGLSYEHVLLPLRLLCDNFFHVQFFFVFHYFGCCCAPLFLSFLRVVHWHSHICKKRNSTNYNNLREWFFQRKWNSTKWNQK